MLGQEGRGNERKGDGPERPSSQICARASAATASGTLIPIARASVSRRQLSIRWFAEKGGNNLQHGHRKGKIWSTGV
eukprot:3919529-Pyramimonas_sp.AAC.1